MRGPLRLAALLVAFAAPAWAEGAQVLSLGGSITEIVYALGAGDRLVARDTTSYYPAEARALPDVGYLRRLSPEGVISVGPDLILAEESAGPPETMQTLAATGIEIVTFPEAFTAAGIAARIEGVGAALGRTEAAADLARQAAADMTEAVTQAAALAGEAPVRAMFILSLAGGRVMAAGTGTSADAIISLSGGQNVLRGFEGYKAVTDEAIVAANPDVILMIDRAGHAVDADTIAGHPALAATAAGRHRRIVTMDGLFLLGFGPRTGAAVRDLASRFYPRDGA